MPEAYKEIWDRDLTEEELDEIALTIDRPDIIYRHRRAFGPRQVSWLIHALDLVYDRIPKENSGLYKVAFEDIVIEFGRIIDSENTIYTKNRLSSLNLFERLTAYQDGDRKARDKASKQAEKRARKMEREQKKRMRGENATR